MQKPINFYLPGLAQDLPRFYIALLRYIKNNPTVVRKGVNVKAFYGTFIGCIWDGGRMQKGSLLSLDEMRKYIETINGLGTAVRYTFTNSQLDQTHLQDARCNAAMRVADNGKNEVLVNSTILEQYLRKNYPNFKYCLSTTVGLKTLDAIEEASEKYDMVVPDYTIIKDLDLLSKIKNKDKIEILVNDTCVGNCPFRADHYKRISKVNLLLLDKKEGGCIQKEKPPENFYDFLEKHKSIIISADEIFDTYVPMGFSNFKLIGRGQGNPVFVFESFIYYLIKQEFRDKVRADLMEDLLDDIAFSRG